MNEIYTDVYVTEAWSKRHANIRDLFEPLLLFRTLMTIGVGGIGKTVMAQKFYLDWAEEKVDNNTQFIFPFTFWELNVLKDRKDSWVELLHHFFADTKDAGICRFDEL